MHGARVVKALKVGQPTLRGIGDPIIVGFGDRLVGRFDLKADRKKSRLQVVPCCYEEEVPAAAHRDAVRYAIARHASMLGFRVGR